MTDRFRTNVHFILILILFNTLLFACSNNVSDYRKVPMVYDINLVDTLSVFRAENLHFEPMLGFVLLPEELLDELMISEDDTRSIIERPLAVYMDSLSQMIIISEIDSNTLSTNEIFYNSFDHYHEIYKDTLITYLRFQYENYLVNQFVVPIQDYIMVKIVVGHLSKNEITNVYMIDFLILRDDFETKMLGVESSLASLKNNI